MNEEDQEAFEEWWDKFPVEFTNRATSHSIAENGWRAALTHERQRSAKLIKCLEKIASNWSEDPRNEAEAALKDYASGEGER